MPTKICGATTTYYYGPTVNPDFGTPSLRSAVITERPRGEIKLPYGLGYSYRVRASLLVGVLEEDSGVEIGVDGVVMPDTGLRACPLYFRREALRV